MQDNCFAAHLAASPDAPVLRPGPASLAAPAPPSPIRSGPMDFHVAGYVDGAGKVHAVPPGKGTRPW